MNLPAAFTNTSNEHWQITVAYGDIVRVRQHVLGADGKPLDLCYIAETGDFRQVIDHIDIVVKCVYWLLYPQLKEHYRLVGEELQECFYNHIDGNTLQAMIKAWYEALVNFTPFQVVNTAMQIAWNEMKQEEIVEAINLLVGQLETSTSTPESSDLTPEDSPMANSSRWLNPV